MKEKFEQVKEELKKRALKKFEEKKKSFNAIDTIKDWVIAFAVAAVVYFVILPALLGSSTPLVVVSSCSEKPYLNIGDIIVIKGLRIPEVTAPNIDTALYTKFEPVFENNITKSIVMANQTFSPSDKNDIIVYYSYPTGLQIIHRALLKVNSQYIITMGDANPIPDQYGENGICLDENVGCLSTYVNDKMLVGKSVFKIPLLGHVKLFFCDIMPFCDGHSNIGTGYKYTLSC